MASGSDKRRRTKIIPVRCTDTEFAVIDAKAEQAGLYPSTYLRAAALGSPGPRAVRRPFVHREELVRVLGELGRIGSNLNQIARSLNIDDGKDHPELAKALDAFAEMRSDLRNALGQRSENDNP